jgi:hypothetical protein
MPELGDLVRVTRPGGASSTIGAGDLKTDAWAIYEAVREAALQAKPAPYPLDHEGVAGYRWIGSVSQKVRALLPHLTDDPDDTQSQGYKRELNGYLRRTVNLVCLAASHTGNSTWWVRSEWNDGVPAPARAPSKMGDLERKLTSREAGEDRPAAPVQQSFKCIWPGCDEPPFVTQGAMTDHHFRVHKSRDAYVMEAVRSLAQPSVAAAVWDRAQTLGYPGGRNSLDLALRDMSEAGVLKRGQGHGPGQPYQYLLPEWQPVPAPPLFRPPAPLPPAEAEPVEAAEPAAAEAAAPAEPGSNGNGDGYTCREPGCGEGPFKTADLRRDHEKLAHPDARLPFHCPACGDGFYSLQAVAIHVAKQHKLHRGTTDYDKLLSQVKDQARKAVRDIPPSQSLPAPTPTATAEQVARAIVAAAQPDTNIPAAAQEKPPAPAADFLQQVTALRTVLAAAEETYKENQKLRQENDELTGYRDRYLAARKALGEE